MVLQTFVASVGGDDNRQVLLKNINRILTFLAKALRRSVYTFLVLSTSLPEALTLVKLYDTKHKHFHLLSPTNPRYDFLFVICLGYS